MMIAIEFDVAVVRNRKAWDDHLEACAIGRHPRALEQRAPGKTVDRVTSVLIARWMARSARSRRIRSSGVSSAKLLWTNHASQSHVIFERSYGAG